MWELKLLDEEMVADVFNEQKDYVSCCLGEGLPPTMFVMCYMEPYEKLSMNVIPIMANFNEHDEKKAILRAAGDMHYGERMVPVAAGMCSEAWLSIRKDADDMPHMQPRDDPFRKEGISICLTFVLPGGGLGMWQTFAEKIATDSSGKWILGDWGEVSKRGESYLMNHFWNGFMECASRGMSEDAMRN